MYVCIYLSVCWSVCPSVHGACMHVHAHGGMWATYKHAVLLSRWVRCSQANLLSWGGDRWRRTLPALLGGRGNGVHRAHELHPPWLESCQHPRLGDALLQNCWFWPGQDHRERILGTRRWVSFPALPHQHICLISNPPAVQTCQDTGCPRAWAGTRRRAPLPVAWGQSPHRCRCQHPGSRQSKQENQILCPGRGSSSWGRQRASEVCGGKWEKKVFWHCLGEFCWVSGCVAGEIWPLLMKPAACDYVFTPSQCKGKEIAV